MMHSPGFDGNSSLSLHMLMNADSLYTAAHCALLLNLKLSHGDYYRKRPALAPGMLVSVCFALGPLRTSDSLWAERDALRGMTHCVPFHTALEWAVPVRLWVVEGETIGSAQCYEPESHPACSTERAGPQVPASGCLPMAQ